MFHGLCLTSVAAALRLNDVDARNHAVFQELARVRQYFDKIKKAEAPPEQRESTLNKSAAIRFLKADLVSSPPLGSWQAQLSNTPLWRKLTRLLGRQPGGPGQACRAARPGTRQGADRGGLASGPEREEAPGRRVSRARAVGACGSHGGGVQPEERQSRQET